MKTLYETIIANGGQQAPALLKHLGANGLHDWGDLNEVNLYDFVDYLQDAVAPGSAKTYAATLSHIMTRYRTTGAYDCPNYAEILRIRGDRPIKTALTSAELERFEQVRTESENERYVQACFSVGARTGMRHSDIMKVRPENIVDGLLTYSSTKTHIIATVPCGERVTALIDYIQTSARDMPLATYNNTVRRLAARAHINASVSIHRGGKDMVRRKCDCLSSHSARISFFTILSGEGVGIQELATLGGHTSTAMTENYIVRTRPKLSDRQLAFFK